MFNAFLHVLNISHDHLQLKINKSQLHLIIFKVGSGRVCTTKPHELERYYCITSDSNQWMAARVIATAETLKTAKIQTFLFSLRVSV